MAWSFRRRIKVIPGVYLNVSKRGVSTTIGVRGASLTFSKDGTYSNVGIPGTGLYSRQKISGRRSGSLAPLQSQPESSRLDPRGSAANAPPDYLYVSADPLDISTDGLRGFQAAVLEANRQCLSLQRDLSAIKTSLVISRIGAAALRLALAYYLSPKLKAWIDNRISSQSQAIFQVKCAINDSSVPLEVQMDRDASCAYEHLISCFTDLAKAQFIWDVTSASDVDRARTRSAANLAVTRRRTSFDICSAPGISSSYPSAHLKNLNGADIFVYPGFFVMYNGPTELGVVDLVDLSASFSRTQFVEQETLPSDSKKVGEVWERSNKDGSRDKRYADNKLLPLMEYGEILFRSSSGVHEKFLVSNASAASRFVDAINDFADCISA